MRETGNTIFADVGLYCNKHQRTVGSRVKPDHAIEMRYRGIKLISHISLYITLAHIRRVSFVRPLFDEVSEFDSARFLLFL